jgi:hypothetical protein
MPRKTLTMLTTTPVKQPGRFCYLALAAVAVLTTAQPPAYGNCYRSATITGPSLQSGGQDCLPTDTYEKPKALPYVYKYYVSASMSAGGGYQPCGTQNSPITLNISGSCAYSTLNQFPKATSSRPAKSRPSHLAYGRPLAIRARPACFVFGGRDSSRAGLQPRLSPLPTAGRRVYH